jgi:3D (Asp-Asp-Asp) domain-containing protein
VTAPAPARRPTPPRPEPTTGARRRQSWIRRVLVNGALFAVGGTVALFGLRLFMPVPVAPTAVAVGDSTLVVPAAGDSAAAADSASTSLDSTYGGLARHAPVVVYSEPSVGPIVVRPPLREAPKPKVRPLLLPLAPMERARAGGSVRVNVTAYCLKGLTRRDHMVRRGIVAADPRYFPLGRYIDLTIGFGYHGRYLVDDTGKDIKGLRLDVWTESCTEARRFGRRFGSAKLVPR